MTPLTENPTVVILVDNRKLPVAIATNVSADLNVIIANTVAGFEDEAKGRPFVTRVEAAMAEMPRQLTLDIAS